MSKSQASHKAPSKKKIQAIRGMNDLLPEQSPLWQYFEGKVRDLMARYGYAEIRTPIVEQTALFARSIGEVTDIVEKEMYTFADRNGDSLTLRPEGTASCVRAAMEHGLLCYPMGGTIDGQRGDHVLLAPPFISSESDLDQIVERLAHSIDAGLRVSA